VNSTLHKFRLRSTDCCRNDLHENPSKMVNSLGLRLSAGSSKTIPITVPISENVPFCSGFVTRGITVVQKECLRPRNPTVGNPFSESPPRCETKSIMIKARAVDQIIYCFQCSFPMSHPEMEKENPPSLGSSYSDPTHVDLFSDETVDPVYQAKAHVLNKAIQEIGMGKYQVSCQYFLLTNFELFVSGICSRWRVLVGLRTLSLKHLFKILF